MASMRSIAGLLCVVASCAGSVGKDSEPGPNGTTTTPGSNDPLPGTMGGPVTTTCATLTTRVWKLTASQYAATLQNLLRSVPNVTEELQATIPTQGGVFTNQAATMPLTEPHLDQLIDSTWRLTGLALRRPEALDPCLKGATWAPACIRGFVEDFAARAFRRDVTAAEIDDLVAFFQKQAGAHDRMLAMQSLLTRILLSPDVQFRTELGDAKDGAQGRIALTKFERAAALSFFLADSPPDDELMAAARNGQLETRGQIETHARRLLGRADTANGLRRMLVEHLRVGEVATAHKDAKLYPEFTPELAGDMARESSRFIDSVLWGSEPPRLSTILSSDYSMINDTMAAFYGIKGVVGSSFRKTNVPAGRGGLLTQASLMATFAHDNDTSPVARGRYVRQTLLCQPLPNPPKDVNAVPPPPDGKRTHRERLEQHSSVPSCATCHTLMDPLGFAFEGFDAIGKYRTMEGGKPVDASGVLSAAEPKDAHFGNARELSALLGRSPDALACLVKRSLEYARGGDMTPDDRCALDALARKVVDKQGDILEMAVAIVTDDTFFVRQVPGM